jgi:cellulose synthase/poly-beta-1,6-N-acetylglucosamine synthase-like glycosyltransferase
MKFNTNVNKSVSPGLSQSLSMQPNKKPVVVCCIPGKEFTPGFFDSWTKFLLSGVRGLPFDIIVSRHYSPVIFHCRANLLGADNRAGIHQIPFQGKIDYDYIMWFDSDIVFEPEHVMKLFNRMQKDRALEVLCGIYLTTSGTHSTIVRDWDLEYFLKTGMFPFLSPGDLKEIANNNPNKLADVFYAGMGFMMCRKGAFEKVTYPWFEPAMHSIETSRDFSSEDVSLCWKWKDAGVKVWVDPDIIVGHEKQVIIR